VYQKPNEALNAGHPNILSCNNSNYNIVAKAGVLEQQGTEEFLKYHAIFATFEFD
jgi:hypothetical protein